MTPIDESKEACAQQHKADKVKAGARIDARGLTHARAPDTQRKHSHGHKA